MRQASHLADGPVAKQRYVSEKDETLSSGTFTQKRQY